jgi:molybdopterin-binding protein
MARKRGNNVHLGFEVRVHLRLSNDEDIWAQITRDTASQLGLEKGKTVYIVTDRSRIFG